MRLRNVAGLALALALFAGILGWLHERQQPPAQPPASRAWLPGLKPHPGDRAVHRHPGQPTIRASAMAQGLDARQQGRLSRLGETIRQLLRSLADARLLEEKSASPENRERMGLSDPGQGPGQPDRPGARRRAAAGPVAGQAHLAGRAVGQAGRR